MAPETVISVSIVNPNDAAYSDEIIDVLDNGRIRAWVRSNNQFAHAPWARQKRPED